MRLNGCLKLNSKEELDMDLFARATKNKYRYASDRGNLTTEQLWDLPVLVLDAMWKDIRKKIRSNSEESLLDIQSKADQELADKADVIKAVVEYKLSVAEKNKKAAETRARKERLMEVLAKKEDEELAGKSAEELKKMIADLG